MPRKGRARRFREARELKQGFDDGLFSKDEGTLADAGDATDTADDADADTWLEDDDDRDEGWDEDDPLRIDEGARPAS